ncbi:unnamed protein product [Owenia fusiformis]|uniref:Flavin-containing monooxygenase n=1 Tax=Owenia fusiformis TaxID=6347 RepID=A0A8J1UF69_OWEFU|nr:unnamed protein product [Owenia fusiformis]
MAKRSRLQCENFRKIEQSRNVSKQNYCFSDYSFPDDATDFPHNTEMRDYIYGYVKHFKLNEIIEYNTQVEKLERKGNEWQVTITTVSEDEQNRIIPVGEPTVIVAKYVAIATGHHAKPTWAKFPGEESFTGSIMHSVTYKDAEFNKLSEKRVVVVGIGNSAVDAVCNLVEVGRCKPVYLSTRSGAWLVPNYIFGCPTDHYANRLFLNLPWQLATRIFEAVITLVNGGPFALGLNPKMRALQTQPTVSPTLAHHIQRGEVKIMPNIKKIQGSSVHFTNDEVVKDVDQLIYCTGYKIDLPYLSDDIRADLLDDATNEISLFKNVFAPKIGPTLAFIGFVQPASGGVLSMSEMQARWFVELCKKTVTLPNQSEMNEIIDSDLNKTRDRYFHSARHTIQKDPIMYCDEIADFIGAKPSYLKHPDLAWRLLLGTNGPAQYRLDGPNPWKDASKTVKKVPLTGLMNYSGILVLFLFVILLINIYWTIYDLLGF